MVTLEWSLVEPYHFHLEIFIPKLLILLCVQILIIFICTRLQYTPTKKYYFLIKVLVVRPACWKIDFVDFCCEYDWRLEN